MPQGILRWFPYVFVNMKSEQEEPFDKMTTNTTGTTRVATAGTIECQCFPTSKSIQQGPLHMSLGCLWDDDECAHKIVLPDTLQSNNNTYAQ